MRGGDYRTVFGILCMCMRMARVLQSRTHTHTHKSTYQDLWHYARKGDYSPYLARRLTPYCAIVRAVGRLLLTVRIQPLTNGRDKMIVTTMSGRSVLETDYSKDEECRVYQARNAIHSAAIALNLATFQTKLDLVLVPSSISHCVGTQF